MLNKKFISLLTTTALVSSMLFIGNTTVADAAIDTSSTPQPMTYKTSTIVDQGIYFNLNIDSEQGTGPASWLIEPIDLTGGNISISDASLNGATNGDGIYLNTAPDFKSATLEIDDVAVTAGASIRLGFDKDKIKKLLDVGQKSLAVRVKDTIDNEEEVVTAFLLEDEYTGGITSADSVKRGDILSFDVDYNKLPINIITMRLAIEDANTGVQVFEDIINLTALDGIESATFDTSSMDINITSLRIKAELFDFNDAGKINLAEKVVQVTSDIPEVTKTNRIVIERLGSIALGNIEISNMGNDVSQIKLSSQTLSFNTSTINKSAGVTSTTLSNIIATATSKVDNEHVVKVELLNNNSQILMSKDITVEVKQPSEYQITFNNGVQKTLNRGTDTTRNDVVITNLPPFPMTIEMDVDSQFSLAQKSWQKVDNATTFTIPATQIQIPEGTQSTNILFTVKALYGTSMVGSSNFTDLVKERTIDEPRISSDIPTIPVGIKTKSGKITISNLPSDLSTTVTLSTDDSKVTLGTTSFTKNTGTTSMDIETDITVDKKFKESRFDLELDIKVGSNTFKKTITVRVSELDKGKVELRSTPIILKDKPVEVTFKVTLPDAEDYDTEDHNLTVEGAKIDSIVRSDKYLDVEKDSDKIVFTSDEYDGKTYEFTAKLTPSDDEVTVTMESDDLFDEVDLKLSSKSGTDSIYKINGLVTEASNNGKEISVGNIFVGNNLQEGIYRIYITKPSTAGDSKTAQTWIKSPEPTFKSAFSNEVNVSIGRSPMLDEYFPNTSYIEFRVNRELKAVEIKNIKISGAKTINDYDIVLAFTEVGSDFTKIDSFPGYLKVNRKVNSIALQVGTDITLVNGEIKKSPNKPTIIDGQPYMQVSFISDALGRFLSWDGNKNSIYISSLSNMDETIEINLNTGGGTKKTSVGTSQIVLKNKPKVIDGRTIISLNDIVTVMNLPQPQWDPITKSIVIKDE